MENRYGLPRQSSGVWRSLRDGDFEEEDVWSVLKDNRTTTDNHSTMNTKNSPSSSSLSVARHVPTAARMIPKATRGGGGGGGGGGGDSSSSSVSSNHEGKILQQSAPVNIPNWHNIYRHKSKISSKNGSWRDDYDDEDDGAEDEEGENDDDDDDEDDCYDNDEHGHKLPPHEFIARRLAKSHISSFSVFEGVGRTLKGRDLSKVRNAVLTKTGFLESL